MPRKGGTTGTPRPAPGQPCGECGQEHITSRGHASCMGHKRFDRDPQSPTYRARLAKPLPCGRAPRSGLDRCKWHGAGNQASKAAADQRVAADKAEKAMRRFGGPVDTSPTEALLDAVRWTAGYVLWLREAVEADNANEGAASKLGEWTDQLRKLCTDAIRCGIEERRVRFAETQGQQVAEAIKGILGDLDLTPEQLARVGEVVPLHLRRLMHVA